MSARATPAPGGDLAPLALQREAAGAWPATEVAQLGGWLLRAAGGFTARANSALPVGDPGLPLPMAMDAVESWYAARSLPAQIVVAGRVGFDVAADPVAAEAIRRHYAASDPTLFLTAATATVLATTAGAADASGVRLTASPDLDESWLTAYGAYRDNARELARAILTGSPAQVFLTADADGVTVGIGRLGVSAGWGGIAAMWVDPAYRRRGLAGMMLTRLAREARGVCADRLHLQVWGHNAPALALYRRFGFAAHHAYVTLTAAAV